MPPKDYKKIETFYVRKKERNIFKRFYQWLFKKYKWQEVKLPIGTVEIMEQEG